MSCLRWGVHLRQQAQVFFHDEQQEWQSPIHRIHLNVQACIPSTSSCRAFPENQIHSSTKHARQTSSLFIYNQEIPQCRRDDIRWRKRKRFLFTPSRQVSYLASVQPQFSGPILFPNEEVGLPRQSLLRATSKELPLRMRLPRRPVHHINLNHLVLTNAKTRYRNPRQKQSPLGVCRNTRSKARSSRNPLPKRDASCPVIRRPT